MFITYKRLTSMRNQISRQADAIRSLEKWNIQYVKDAREALDAKEAAEAKMREMETMLSVLNDRCKFLRKAFDGMQDCMKKSIADAAELRGQNKVLNDILDRVSATNNAMLIEAAFPSSIDAEVVEDGSF